MKLAIAGGGTGGHLFPGIAVAEAAQKASDQHEVLFVGSGRELEQRLVRDAGFEIENLPATAIVGKGLRGILRFALSLPRGLAGAMQLLRRFEADIVIGSGGYVSFVPAFAAIVRRIPLVLLEPNVQVGLANKVLSLFARRIFAVPGAKGFWRTSALVSIPNPVREKFYSLPPARLLSANPERLSLLVFGGSQGARSLNDAVLAVSELLAEVDVVHQTGASDLARVAESYRGANLTNTRVAPFVEDMASAYRDADLVICRAGAMTVAELQAVGRPAIFVPLPIAGGHQRENCRELVEAGAALSVEDGEATAEELREILTELLSPSSEKLSSLTKRAAETSQQRELRPASEIVESLLDLAEQGREG